MQTPDFALERYFARWEFAVRHLMCASDVEGWPMAELLALADPERARALGRPSSGLRPSRPATPSSGRRSRRSTPNPDRDEVLVFSGAQEAIFCLAIVPVGPGDHAIVTWPGYQSLYEVARAAGADVTLHELHEADGWGLDVPRLVAAFRPATRLVVVNAPHNPTGMLPTHAEWRALGDPCAAAGVRLLADEVYRFLEPDGGRPCRPGRTVEPSFVSIGVLSKTFALAGLRIGWLATRDRDLLARCAALKDYTTICPPTPSEVLALIGLRAREAVLARSRRPRRG